MKKFGLAVLLLLCLAVAPLQSHAQAAAYGAFSASDFTDSTSNSTWLYGGTAGILVDGPGLFKHHLVLGADLQGRFLHGNNFDFDGLAIGPRLSMPIGKNKGFKPYVELSTGFARLHASADPTTANQVSTTDALLQFSGGIQKRLTPHIDVLADYTYTQYYAFMQEYDPQTVSIGVAYYFSKR